MNTTETTIDVNYLRSLINFANKQGGKPRKLFDYIQENDAELDEIIESVKNNFCDLFDILNGYTFTRDGYYYDSDAYVIADDTDNILHIEEANYCEYSDTYVEGDVVEVYISSRYSEYWLESTAEDKAHYYQGAYYSELPDLLIN